MTTPQPPRIHRRPASRGPDIEALRHKLADRLDAHPVRTWSAPLLVAIIGALDAHTIACEMGFDPAQTSPLIRLVQ